jgi:hypothetical protein
VLRAFARCTCLPCSFGTCSVQGLGLGLGLELGLLHYSALSASKTVFPQEKVQLYIAWKSRSHHMHAGLKPADLGPDSNDPRATPFRKRTRYSAKLSGSPRFCGRSFSVWTQFTVLTGKRSEHPRGLPLVTRMLASSEQEWEPMAFSSVDLCRKTRTVRSRIPCRLNLCCLQC